MSSRIPARVIHIGWEASTLPARCRDYERRSRELNPGYEFAVYWKEQMAAFVRDEYPEFLDAYTSLQSTAQKTDLFRLLAVHKLGGFYLDMDVRLVRPLDRLREHSCVFPFERCSDPFFASRYGQIESLGQFAFGAVAGHPFLMACAENIRRALSDRNWANVPPPEVTATFLSAFGDAKAVEVFYTTGPAMVSRTYAERPDLREAVRVLYAKDPSSGTHLNWCFGVYGVHRMEGAWRRVQSSFLARRIQDRRRDRFVRKLEEKLAECVEP